MRLAVNYSKPVTDLLRERRVEIDFLKCPPWPDTVEEAKRFGDVVVHFDLRAGSGLSSCDWGTVERLLESTPTRYVSLHLGPSRSDLPGMRVDSLSPNDTEVILEKMLHDVQTVTSRYGSENVIVENVPYFGSWGNSFLYATQPSTIAHIVNETGCGLLFDIAHALVTAHNGQTDYASYVSALPMHALREAHFAGTVETSGGGLRDHLPAGERDWQALQHLIDGINSRRWPAPWLLCFEYGGSTGWFAEHSDPDVLADQIPRIRQRILNVRLDS